MANVTCQMVDYDENVLDEDNTVGGVDSTRDDEDVQLLAVDDMPSTYRTTLNRDHTIELSYAETRKLVRCLQDTTRILTHHTEHRPYMERCPQRLHPASTTTRCLALTSFLSRSLYKITGAKGISATILLQLVCLVMLTLVDCLPKNETDKHTALQWGSIMMIILQSINLVIVILISIQLAKQIKKRRVSRVLLMQSYLATILVFAGIYTATYRMDLKSWKFVAETDENTSPVMIVNTYMKFLFFSVSTATLCGAADALPKEWYTCAFTSVQMLLSFMYFTSVLGFALVPSKEPDVDKCRVEKDTRAFSLEKDIRELGKDLKELQEHLLDIDNNIMNTHRR